MIYYEMISRCFKSQIVSSLLNPQNPRSLPPGCLLLLVALSERRRALVVTTKVVRLLDLVDSDDPVLAGEGLLDSAELRAFGRQSRSTNTVLRLSSREERVVIVVRHLVPNIHVSKR
jgi:hypothetical protein